MVSTKKLNNLRECIGQLSETSRNKALSSKVQVSFKNKPWFGVAKNFAQRHGLTILGPENSYLGVTEKDNESLHFQGEWANLQINGVFENTRFNLVAFSKQGYEIARYENGTLKIIDGGNPKYFVRLLNEMKGITILKDWEAAVQEFTVEALEEGYSLLESPYKSTVRGKPLKRRRITPQERLANQRKYRQNREKMKKASRRYARTANGKKAKETARRRRKMRGRLKSLHAGFDPKSAFSAAKEVSSTFTRLLIECEHNPEAFQFLEQCGPTLTNAVGLLPIALIEKDQAMLNKAIDSIDCLFEFGSDETDDPWEGEEDFKYPEGYEEPNWDMLSTEELQDLLGEEFYQSFVLKDLSQDEMDNESTNESAEHKALSSIFQFLGSA